MDLAERRRLLEEKFISTISGVFSTPEIRKRLLELLRQGIKQTIIAQILTAEFNTEVKKNHVSGVRERLRQYLIKMKVREPYVPAPKQVKPSKVKTETPRPTPAPVLVKKEEVAVETGSVVLPNGKPVTLETLEKGMCGYPFNFPGAANYHYCGDVTTHKGRYCETHKRVMHQPQRSVRGILRPNHLTAKVFG